MFSAMTRLPIKDGLERFESFRHLENPIILSAKAGKFQQTTNLVGLI